MKKKWNFYIPEVRRNVQKLLLIMKLTFLLTFLLVVSASANTYSQMLKLSLNFDNVKIEQVLHEIEESSQFVFLYEQNTIDKTLNRTINVKDESIEFILTELFSGTNVKYKIDDRQILLYNESQPELKTVISESTTQTTQKLTVTGKISDSKGEVVPGASVLIQGTNIGTVSNMDGIYTLTNVPPDAVLVISFIGMQQTEVRVDGKTNIDISLRPDVIGLDEVVAVGYGTVKRADITGAVASVKGENLASNPVPNVAQAMQGRLLGVNVSSQDGRPGASMSIRVRGGGSITQSNDPLYIVDGFPVGTISDIPASEIESIDVLKDAASTAIYGARGANGVIMVTTKSGKAGKVKVSYDAYMKVGTVAKTLETLSAQDYILNSWSYAASRGSANQDAVEKYFGLGSNYGNHYSDYAKASTHDYTDDLLRTSTSQSHYVTISGGSETTKVNSTIGYVSEEGIKINSDFNRINASLKVQQDLADNLKLDFDVRYTESETSSGRESGAATAYTYRPIDNPLGGVDYTEVASGFSFGIANIDDQHDPVKLTNDITSKSISNSLRGSVALSWEIISGLTARSELGITKGNTKNTYYEDGYTNGEKRATLSRGESNGLRSVSTLNYKFDVNERNKFTVLLGNEVLKSKSEATNMEGRDYPDDFDYDKTMGLIHTASNSFSSTNNIAVPSETVSFFGRLNYSLNDRYLLTATYRADGSSKFAPNNRWGYFPAAALAWRVFDEPFMESTRNWLSNLKIRLSMGTAGADNISSNLWRETWSSLSATNNHTPINGELIPFYKPDGLLANPNLKWETTISRNLGIDYGIMNNVINGSIEVYWNTTKDLLMAVPVDNTSGYSYQYQNFGQTSNKGIEVALNADVIRTADFRLNLGVIYNYNRNNLDELQNAEQYLYSSYWASSALVPTNDYMFEEGKPIGLARGFNSDGYYSVDDFNYVDGQYILKDGVADISAALTGAYKNPFNLPEGQNAFPGSAKYIDTDKSGTVDMDDATFLDEMIPSHTGSFQFNANYKNFDLSTNFTWVLGGKVYNVAALRNTMGDEFVGIGKQRASWVADAYKVYNVDAAGDLYAVTDPDELRSLNANAKSHLPYHQNAISCSDWLEDGSYLRLQTLSIGYNLPKSILNKLKIDKARFYVTASNLFTITGYSGLDPEVSVTPTGRSGYFSDVRIFPTPNMDNGAYPRARTFTIGTNITF